MAKTAAPVAVGSMRRYPLALDIVLDHIYNSKDTLLEELREEYNQLRGVLRRTDLPCIEIDGKKEWESVTGNAHRENDLPAIVMKCGSMFWAFYGVLHRENDKPAIFIRRAYPDPCGVMRPFLQWRVKGEIHRGGDKPASISATEVLFYQNGARINVPIKKNRGIQTQRTWCPGLRYDGNRIYYMDELVFDGKIM